MNYKAILLHAYQMTVRNPVLWFFGLFLSSGFNLNIFYALVSHRSGIVWDAMRQALAGRPLLVGLSGVGAFLVFLILNYIKAWFVSEAHEHIHPHGEKCPLCVQREHRQVWPQRLPSLNLFGKVILASALTIGATLVTAAPLNLLILRDEILPGVFGLTVIATLVVVCVLACWNIFTVLYLIYFKQRFGNAARLSIDLITMRSKHVFEFALLILLLYVVVVGVGSLLITAAQVRVDWSGLALPAANFGKALFGLMFAFWLAITNVFFNLAMLLFFDQLVKPIEKPAPISTALPDATH